MSYVLTDNPPRDSQSDRVRKLGDLFKRKLKKSKITYSVRVDADMNDRLSEIQKQTGAKSVNEVFNDALVFYDVILQEKAEGNIVTVTTQKGDKVRYDVFPE